MFFFIWTKIDENIHDSNRVIFFPDYTIEKCGPRLLYFLPKKIQKWNPPKNENGSYQNGHCRHPLQISFAPGRQKSLYRHPPDVGILLGGVFRIFSHSKGFYKHPNDCRNHPEWLFWSCETFFRHIPWKLFLDIKISKTSASRWVNTRVLANCDFLKVLLLFKLKKEEFRSALFFSKSNQLKNRTRINWIHINVFQNAKYMFFLLQYEKKFRKVP